MNVKTYKTMSRIGGGNIAIGGIVMVVGIVIAVLVIINVIGRVYV